MTFYASRETVNNVLPKNYASSTNIRQSTLASQGLIMLHRNNNYSNTMRPCVYICKRNKIHWM